MNFVPLALYGAAFVAYAWHFAQRNPLVGRAATTLLIFAALTHTFVIGMQTMEIGHVPIAGTTSAISTFVWLLALAYLYIELTTDERAMGVFILPLLVALQTIPALQPATEARSDVLRGPLFGIHVSSLLFAYASFALACVIGITYVLLFKEIKAKHLGFFYARLPSLQVLDRMNQVAIVIGWIFLTVGLIAGVVWAGQARAYAASDPRVQAMSLQDPKIFGALVCWILYSFELFAARSIGWGGRRSAYLSALGFVIVLLNFVPISYFLTRSHNF
ncbi:MAG TPA: cytochrome c biogenesis protein CcsA [Vicinamibacterales bacterium]|jgi:ABC-type transport system involved in cytochrome c biogenesis permease subunit|nr:cytochrome c biogenesis protein CcsA [Vicinamibacterales bacterium]